MDMEMTKDERLLGRRRGLSLVEVLIAIVVISVALGALLNVFSHTLRLTTESAMNSGNLMAAYAQGARIFFLELIFYSFPFAGATSQGQVTNAVLGTA